MSTRQDKVSKQIQKDIADIIQHHTNSIAPGKMLTVTNVRITPDLGVARIYISVFPSDKAAEVVLGMNNHKSMFRNELGKKLRHQLKKVPEITFYEDDSLDYVNNIENLLNQ